MQEVKQTNNSLVTKVAQRPQTGQRYGKYTPSGAIKAVEKRAISGKIGRPGQRGQLGQSKKQMVVMNASANICASEMSKSKISKSALRLMRAESNKENKARLQDGDVARAAQDLQSITCNASSQSALDDILGRTFVQRQQSDMNLMKLRERQLQECTTQEVKPQPSRNLTKVSNLTKIVVSRVHGGKHHDMSKNFRTSQGLQRPHLAPAFQRQNSASTINKM